MNLTNNYRAHVDAEKPREAEARAAADKMRKYNDAGQFPFSNLMFIVPMFLMFIVFFIVVTWIVISRSR